MAWSNTSVNVHVYDHYNVLASAKPWANMAVFDIIKRLSDHTVEALDKRVSRAL